MARSLRGGAQKGLLLSFPLPACLKVGEGEQRAFMGTTHLTGLWPERGRVTAVVAIAANRIPIALPWTRQSGGDLPREKFKINKK